jgi:hypothetical protein
MIALCSSLTIPFTDSMGKTGNGNFYYPINWRNFTQKMAFMAIYGMTPSNFSAILGAIFIFTAQFSSI